MQKGSRILIASAWGTWQTAPREWPMACTMPTIELEKAAPAIMEALAMASVAKRIHSGGLRTRSGGGGNNHKGDLPPSPDALAAHQLHNVRYILGEQHAHSLGGVDDRTAANGHQSVALALTVKFLR